ncbi:MAG TPA: tRNA pseudouridine(13) synthase TruD [Tepidisphaeraceae bacterium]|jgi:tRNA pseudouridine13 synthase|nr:tRNA pseudouridine(13) synthase TruD [Tepidisphaeraceae bacterium]
MHFQYLTADLPGVGGIIKARPEDFFVQELPLYEPSGEGEHVYCEIQKIGIPTFAAIDRLAEALDVPPRDIGYAGMKDAQAISRQILSIRGATESAVMELKLPGITVLWAARHGNKLRLGHLAGNRFAIKIREVEPTDVLKVQPILARLTERGMPNYFGEQRFGRRGDNDQLGAAFVRGDDAELIRLFLGNPMPRIDDSNSHMARKSFESGDRESAMKHWPRRCGLERRVLARFIKTDRAAAAVRLIDDRLRRLWVSALQSRVFNAVVSERIGSLDRLILGDLAMKHENGACFPVTDPPGPAAEQLRADAFEISPTGPLVGYRMTLPAGEPLAMEQAAWGAAGLKPADFRRTDALKVKGARRPLRVRPEQTDLSGGVDEHGGYITVSFTLPAGSFATVLLGEVMKKSVEDSQ